VGRFLMPVHLYYKTYETSKGLHEEDKKSLDQNAQKISADLGKKRSN
jgi:hypothetical protein